MKMQTTEIWRQINGFPEHEVSDLGRIRRNGIIRSTGKTSTGYQICTLRENGICKTLSISRIVADAFISKPEGAKVVGFRDGDKNNCSAENLYWKVPEKFFKKEKMDFAIYKKRLEYIKSLKEQMRFKLQAVRRDAVEICDSSRYYEEPEEIRLELRKIDSIAFEIDKLLHSIENGKEFFAIK